MLDEERNLPLLEEVDQMESAFPRNISTSAHDWGQVLMFQGKSGSVFGSFTNWGMYMPFQPFLFTHSLLNLSATTRYLQHFMLIFQTESGFSKKRCSDVQEWGQVCSFQGKNCGGFGAFTSFLTHIPAKLRH